MTPLRNSAQSHRSEGQGGFTLIEITIAVLILAGSLVTLLGLQSSAIDQAVRDRNKELAMFIARQILADIELSEGARVEARSGPVLELLKYHEIAPVEDPRVWDAISTYQAELTVDDWGIPDVDDKAMKRISLTISWANNSLDRLQVVYFVPYQPPDEP